MVSSLNNTATPREMGYNVIEHIGGRIQANAGGAVVTARLGKIPAGCLILYALSRVAVAVTGGTPVLSIGSLGDTGLDNLVAAIAETAGSELLMPLTAFTNPLLTDTEFYGSIAGGATAGDAWLIIAFCRPQTG